MTTQARLFAPPPSSPKACGPVLHLRAWAWVAARQRAKAWPPPGFSGRAYTIMALPRPWEHGDGRCAVLVPQGEELEAMRALVLVRQQGLDVPDLLQHYRELLGRRWSTLELGPGQLQAATPSGPATLQEGDALCCACSADEALAGRCHRAMAAPWLVQAGWSVFLDGTSAG